MTYEPITDANFQDAVNLWFSDEANATHVYGHISDWNAFRSDGYVGSILIRPPSTRTSMGLLNVTNMSDMFTELLLSINQLACFGRHGNCKVCLRMRLFQPTNRGLEQSVTSFMDVSKRGVRSADW